jgi:hypothetical protein
MEVDQVRPAERLQDALHLGERAAEFVARERQPQIARAGTAHGHGRQRGMLGDAGAADLEDAHAGGPVVLLERETARARGLS